MGPYYVVMNGVITPIQIGNRELFTPINGVMTLLKTSRGPLNEILCWRLSFSSFILNFRGVSNCSDSMQAFA